MSDLLIQYRQLAQKARADAEAASLPNVQQLHLRSSERLDEIVLRLESVAEAKMRNDEAKATKPSSSF